MLLTLSFEVTAVENSQLPKLSLAYINDINDTLSIHEVINLPFTPIPNKNSLGIYHKNIWYKVTLTSPLEFTPLFLHEETAYLSRELDVYEVLTNQKIIKKRFSFFYKKGINALEGSTLVYPITMLPGTSKTIFINKKSHAYQLINLAIYDKHHSSQALINRSFYPTLIVSSLITLALYNVMIFFYSRRKEFLIYSLYLLAATIGSGYLYGTFFNNFNLYGEPAYWLPLSIILVPLFLALFAQTVFETQNNCKKAHLFFNISIVIALIDLTIAIFIDFQFAFEIIGVVFICAFASICYMALYFYKRKHPLIKIFIVAYCFYISGLIYHLSMMLGYIPYNSFSFYASGIGMLIEAFLFSYLLNFRINLLEKEITKLVEVQNDLKIRADYDGLTQILNRRAFMEQAEAAFSLAKRHNESLSVIMIDLDFFKSVNDNYGHHTGDIVLSLFAKIVSPLIRNEDIFGRVGGEEFSIIFPKLTEEKALFAADKIRQAIADEMIASESGEFQQTISIGLSTLVNKDKTYNDMQKRADKALYQAKSNGRNQVVFQ